MSLLNRIEKSLPPSDLKDRHALRKWWHGILRDHGRYSCYAIFLVLPSDKEAIRYLTDFGSELDVISGENCLVIAFGKTEFRRSGFDTDVEKGSLLGRFSSFLDDAWNAAVREQISQGYSVKISEIFDVPLTQFPCLLIFEDIRSPKHVVVTLKGLTADEIASQMRAIFAIVQKAIVNKNDVLDALARYQSSEVFRKKGKVIVSHVNGIAAKTFETAMEAWINTLFKP